MSAAEYASKASSVEQANEWVMRANERTDKQMAQYLHLNSWLIWTTVLEAWLRVPETPKAKAMDRTIARWGLAEASDAQIRLAEAPWGITEAPRSQN